MFRSLTTIIPEAASSPEAASVLLTALLSLVVSALGLIASRQWYLLIVYSVLLMLVGFLLNPLADSTTPLDLKSTLTSPDFSTVAGILQLLLLGASIYTLIKVLNAADPTRKDRWQVAFGITNSLPLPAVALALLLTEQALLARGLNVRPEQVGLFCGVLATSVLIVVSLLFLCLPSRLRYITYFYISIAAILATSLLLTMQAPLPTIPASTEPLLPKGTGIVLAVTTTLILTGAMLAWRKQRRSSSASV
jgi:hypothetical protein